MADAEPIVAPLLPSGEVDWEPEVHGWREVAYGVWGDTGYEKEIAGHVWMIAFWHHGWWVQKDGAYLDVPFFETAPGCNNVSKLCWEIEHGLGMARPTAPGGTA